MSGISKIRKGWRLLKCKAFGRPLDVELQQDVHEWRLRLRLWRSVITRSSPEVRLHHEFNLWATKGVGEGMDNPHRRIIDLAITRMGLEAGDRILDLACGAGMASRLMMTAQPECERVVGLDISDGMLIHARKQSAQFRKMNFVCGSAERLPFRDGFFSKILSVEAFYYFENQDEVLAEMQRVLSPGGRLFLLICLYKDYAESLKTVEEVDVPVYVRSIAEYKALLEHGGWTEVQAEEFIRESHRGCKPDVHDRAVLLSGRKPLATPTNGAMKKKPIAEGKCLESLV